MSCRARDDDTGNLTAHLLIKQRGNLIDADRLLGRKQLGDGRQLLDER